jgi:hypothetical protein
MVPDLQSFRRLGAGREQTVVAPALLGADELLDTALNEVLGLADAPARDAIAAICNDALAAVLGPAAAGLVRADHGLLARVAPWVWDLARGLQYQNRHGAAQPATTGLLAQLRGRPLPGGQARQFAETIDLAVVLTLDRVTDQVLGPGACARDPAENEAAAPWLAGLRLGYRIHLARELLRLSALG